MEQLRKLILIYHACSQLFSQHCVMQTDSVYLCTEFTIHEATIQYYGIMPLPLEPPQLKLVSGAAQLARCDMHIE